MGLLNDDFYTQNPAPAPVPQAPPQPPAQGGVLPTRTPAPATQPAGLQKPTGTLSAEEQTKKFGGPVGSAAYLERNIPLKVTGRDVLSTVLPLPNQQDWDRMTTKEKLQNIRASSIEAAIHLIKSAPVEIAKAPVRISNTLMAGAGGLADKVSGKEGSFFELANQQQVPVSGIVPNYFNTYDEAIKSGMGPLGASIVTGTLAFGDVTIGLVLGNDLKASFAPRSKTAAGVPVLDTAPIQKLIDGTRKVESVSEYYSMPKTVAKKYGGNEANTFWKMTPAQGGTEISIVQKRGGMLSKAVDRIKGRGEMIYQGDFGPEIKLMTQTVPTDMSVAPAPITKQLPSIPDKPLKGFADKPVTAAHVENLENIARAAGLDDAISQSVLRSVTGKRAVGELTQAEYVETARAMGALAKSSRLADGSPVVNPIAQYMSPQRHFTRSIEERGGPKVYSEGYVRVEDAFQNKRIFLDNIDQQLKEIYGKYEGPSFAEERRLIREATEGRTEAIQANPDLTPEVKSELMEIVGKRQKWLDETGQSFGIDKKYFIDKYSPRIQDVGGVHQLYKEGVDIPKEFSPFFEKKRKGALHVQVDDALVLDQIYARAGANKLFLNPALKGVNELVDSLAPGDTLRGSMRSYVQEKLGYAGRTEQYLDEAMPKMLKKLPGVSSVPPDIARQVAQFVMNTTYSSALGFRVGSAVRNTFTAFNSYVRQGPKFFGEALAKAMTKEGIAELRKRGLLVKLGVPSGADLAQEASMLGKAKGRYTRFTQASLKGQEMSDSFTRATAFWQGKLQWDDALARYKSGALKWSDVERELDFNSLSPVDQNIIRKDLVAGNVDKAFNHYIRDIIDETNFPFRRGASFRAGYGLAGKAGFQFTQWPIEQAHMLGRWAKTGQVDKIVRWLAVSTALNRSMNEMFGVDVSNSLGIRTVVPGAAPLVKIVTEAWQAWSQFVDGNYVEMEKHRDELSRALKLGQPIGIQTDAVQSVLKSIDKGPIGPDGKYPVYSGSGKLNRWSTFQDLMKKILGFVPSEEGQEKKKGQMMRTENFFLSRSKGKALELMQQSLQDDGTFDTSSAKYQDALELIEKNQIKIGPEDFKAYYIPYNERLFNQLPASLKAKFAPRVFPQE